MSISIEQYERLSHFLDAEMTMAEMEAFEKELSANPALHEQLNFEMALRDGLAIDSIKAQAGNLQHKLEQTKIYKIVTAIEQVNEHKQDSSKKIVPHRHFLKSNLKWLSIAAAAIVLIGVGIFFITKPKPSAQQVFVKLKDSTVAKTNNLAIIEKNKLEEAPAKAFDCAALYKKYFTKDKLPETYPLLLADAFSNYENGNYTSIERLSLTDISELRGEDELNNKQNILQFGHYYKGIAFLETNNTQQAITNFNWVIKNQPSKSMRTKTLWYLALAYLKENDKEKAAELCNDIISNKTNEALVKNAQELFGAIKK